MRGCRLRLVALLSAVLFVACRSPRQEGQGEEPAGTSQAAQAKCERGQLAGCERDCERGDNSACELVTDMYLRGVGTARSAEKAALLNKRLCESGRRYFCPTYAFVLFLGRGVPKDGARARQLFAENCQHDPKACSEYGSLIAVGTGVPQDLEFGVFLLDLACRERNAMACRDLQRLRAQGLYPKDGSSPPAEQ